ncbi:MAG: FAD-dependent oxidoreductase [Hyphomicrobium sp.]
MKVVIVGGVAGGASCAARLRRLDEKAEILLIERGPYISYANCGLPYHVGGIIENEASLLVANSALFKSRFAIDVRSQCEVTEILPREKLLKLKNRATGEIISETYDKLVLSPGAKSIRPPFEGIDLPGIFEVRTVPDARNIRAWLKNVKVGSSKPKVKAIVVGGGFIGLEMAENLLHLGHEVTLIEKGDQVLPMIDWETAHLVMEHLIQNHIHLMVNTEVVGFKKEASGTLKVEIKNGSALSADIVILALGVRPDIELARCAGLEIGQLGGIRVNEQMRTSDPDIFAVGDVIEVKDFMTGHWELVALAGPANRQGRIAADVIAGRPSKYRGTQGTAIVGLFGSVVAWTGMTERKLLQLKDTDYEKIYLYPNSHAGYYPGAKMIKMKVIFRKSNGLLLGAQAIGEDGVDKRISTLAAMIQLRATIYDLEEAELCYAPQFGSAKDPINFAGMIAADVLRGDMPLSHWEKATSEFLLDVREPAELEQENIPKAYHIPLGQLRTRLKELPKEKEIHVLCRSGQRAYYATRVLLQHGFKVKNISGGMLSFLDKDTNAGLS